jgi:hypothetical protein
VSAPTIVGAELTTAQVRQLAERTGNVPADIVRIQHIASLLGRPGFNVHTTFGGKPTFVPEDVIQ